MYFAVMHSIVSRKDYLDLVSLTKQELMKKNIVKNSTDFCICTKTYKQQITLLKVLEARIEPSSGIKICNLEIAKLKIYSQSEI